MTIEWKYASVDLADDSTTVESVPCLVKGITVTTGNSAHACPIKDDSTPVFSIPASQAIGYEQFPGGDQGIRFETSLVVDPHDSATGVATIFYKILGE